MNNLKWPVLAAALAAGALADKASAAVTFDGSSGALGAEATFSTDAQGDLVVTLINTSGTATANQSQVLTAVFFSGANGLTPVQDSALLSPGSKEWEGSSVITTDPATVLGQQWEYASGLKGSNIPGGASDGISSSGLNIFGDGNFAPNGVPVDGSAYGLLSASYNGVTGNGNGGLGTRQYVSDSMTFKLSGFNGNLSSIGDVFFQFGTATSDPSFAGTQSNPGGIIIGVPEANYGFGAACAMLPVIGFAGLKRLRKARA